MIGRTAGRDSMARHAGKQPAVLPMSITHASGRGVLNPGH